MSKAKSKPETVAEVPQLLWKAPQAARALNLGKTKLWSMTAGGEIPCVRIGSAVRYCPADIEAWIEQQKTRK